jgi:hypothetical protein
VFLTDAFLRTFAGQPAVMRAQGLMFHDWVIWDFIHSKVSETSGGNGGQPFQARNHRQLPADERQPNWLRFHQTLELVKKLKYLMNFAYPLN